jgi:5-methyltetrahydrofolate corrinoid/iron sulfur protein methyltransferase
VLLAADNLHALNEVFSNALESLDPAPIRELVKRCQKAGASLLDLNPGHLSRRKEDRIEFLVDTVQEVSDLPLILDNPNPRVLERGIAACKNTPIINALSLEESKLDGILPLAVEHRTDLVLLLMDERSFTPRSLEEKIGIALQLREHCISAGLPNEALIYDPVLPNLSWDDAYFRISEDIKTVRLLSSGAIFQEPARTMVGLSNMRSGMSGRKPVSFEQTCMGLLAGAGLSIVLANVLQPDLVNSYNLIESTLLS